MARNCSKVYHQPLWTCVSYNHERFHASYSCWLGRRYFYWDYSFNVLKMKFLQLDFQIDVFQQYQHSGLVYHLMINRDRHVCLLGSNDLQDPNFSYKLPLVFCYCFLRCSHERHPDYYSFQYYWDCVEYPFRYEAEELDLFLWFLLMELDYLHGGH